jgi:hypothetical protein
MSITFFEDAKKNSATKIRLAKTLVHWQTLSDEQVVRTGAPAEVVSDSCYVSVGTWCSLVAGEPRSETAWQSR